ncbi:MAG: flagellar biosynthetic protein FliO [Ruminococcus sp.]|jgi:flagellar biosynthetic protein FliO|nr:flagellar biosynthetic protein FliO [Ruminococcus sp.]
MKFDDILSIFITLILFVAVIFLAMYSTKFIGKRFSVSMGGKNMKIIERIALGPDKMLLLVKIADKAMLVGVTTGQITNLSEIDPETLEIEPEITPKYDFKNILGNVLNRNEKGSDTNNKVK